MKKKLYRLWNKLYPDETSPILDNFYDWLLDEKTRGKAQQNKQLWYTNAVFYALYVDLFASDFKRLETDLDYLKSLGITALWLLPVLESPMKDHGFDISDYYTVREDLGGNTAFQSFLDKAKKLDIRVMFDIALNHVSNKHAWFMEAAESDTSYYRDFFIWSSDKNRYSSAINVFSEIGSTLWEYNSLTKDYYFHTFYKEQPELNYANPYVLVEAVKVLLFWKKQGVDGFRLDACPHYWKKEQHSSVHLPEVHIILQFFRTVLDYIDPGTFLLAEVAGNQKLLDSYLGKNTSTQGVYNFPLQNAMFASIADKNISFVKNELKVMKQKNKALNKMTLIQCHDNMMTEHLENRKKEAIHKNLFLKPEWLGFSGFSARLFDVLGKNPYRVLAMRCLQFAMPGSPIIYYGNELGQETAESWYKEMVNLLGIDDLRFLQRGYFDRKKQLTAKTDLHSPESIIYHGTKNIIMYRKKAEILMNTIPKVKQVNSVTKIQRKVCNKKVTIFINLSDKKKTAYNLNFKPYEYCWINLL